MQLRQRVIDIPLGFAREHLENELIKRATCRMIQNVMDKEVTREQSAGHLVLHSSGLLDHQEPVAYVTLLVGEAQPALP